MPLLSRLYVWSVVLEPLLMFQLFDRRLTGLTISVSRLLQVLVLVGVIVRIVAVAMNQRTATRLAVPSLAGPLYKNFAIYFCLAIFAGFIGVLSGAYDVSVYDYNPEITINLARFVTGNGIRPAIEYFLTGYYFVYFVVLPTYLLQRQKDLGYFFWAFKVAVVGSLVIGFAGLALNALDVPFYLPRSFADTQSSPSFVGVGGYGEALGDRFHGLYGEPRQAFTAVFLGLAMLHLGAFHKGLALRRVWTIAAITAAVLTQSASGIVGIVCFAGLYSLYSLSRMGVRSAVRLVSVVSLVLVLSVGAAYTTDRLVSYLGAVPELWEALENSGPLPGQLAQQHVDIYPLYELTVKWRNNEMLPIVIGSGFGSASVVNNRRRILEATRSARGRGTTYVPQQSILALSNPHSQFVRTIYESGVLGLGFFILGFVLPVQYVTRHHHPRIRHRFIMLSLLVMGCCLGYRTTAIFIYLGAVVALFRAGRAPVARMSA